MCIRDRFSSAICLSTPFSECVFIFARRHPNLYANAIAQSKTIACVTNPRDTSTTGEEDASLFVLFMMMMMMCDSLSVVVVYITAFVSSSSRKV